MRRTVLLIVLGLTSFSVPSKADQLIAQGAYDSQQGDVPGNGLRVTSGGVNTWETNPAHGGYQGQANDAGNTNIDGSELSGAPKKTKAKKHKGGGSVVGAATGMTDRTAKTGIGMTDRAAKTGVGLTDRAAKTGIGLTDRAAKSVVGGPAKAVKEMFKAVF